MRSGTRRCSELRSKSTRVTPSMPARSGCGSTRARERGGNQRRRSCSAAALVARGPSFGGCCDVLNFFETRENAERYLAEHGEVAGHPISLPEAIEAGRIVFGDVLREGD